MLSFVVSTLGCSDAGSSSDDVGVTTDPGSEATTADPATDTTGDGDGDGDGDGEPEPLDPDEEHPDGAFEGCSGPGDCPSGYKCGEIDAVDDMFGMGFSGQGCVPIEGDGTLGESCELRGYLFGEDGYPIPGAHVWAFATDDCARDFQCIGGEGGVCLRECVDIDGEDACGPTESCPWIEFRACHPHCDPLAANTCPHDLHCNFFLDSFDSFLCSSLGLPEGSSGEFGQPCSPFNSGPCKTGLACVPEAELGACASSYCCTQLCELDDPDACAALGPEFSCVAHLDNPPAIYENLGHCAG